MMSALAAEKSGVSRIGADSPVCHHSLSVAYRVLIVDDHPSFRATARAVLTADGFEVVGEAEDGRSALEAIERLRPDLVLLDVQLPDTDGFSIAIEVCKLNGDAPTIVLTSSHDAADFGPLVGRCGAAAFVPKAELNGAALRAVLR
jgi:DNA-binding NarL/FixJ family response regulator